MSGKKNILAIIGSASTNSSNQKLVEHIKKLTIDHFKLTIYNRLKEIPHFDPELSNENLPENVLSFITAINHADGVLICTPEYIFSIPSGLKNAIEWCVSTTIFTNKPIALITASAQGEKGHEELQMIMRTLMSNFTDETTLLIQGIKGKINEKGELSDQLLSNDLDRLITAFKELVEDKVISSNS